MYAFGIIFSALFVAVIHCDASSQLNQVPESRVIGGHDATVGQFAHQVSLRRAILFQHFCGGSIITNRHILTAAHCTLRRSARMTIAVVGALNRKHDGIKYRLESIFNHENYDFKMLANDIALLKTKDEIIFSDVVKPIALPTSQTATSIQALVSGWGQTSHPPKPGSLLPNVLQFKSTLTLSLSECLVRFKGYPHSDFITDGNICTTNPLSKGVCMGDSGGPLISDKQNRTLIGIVSWGIACAQGFPDVYTNVFSHMKWITSKMDL